MTSEYQAVQQFVIPRKGGNTQQGTQSSRLLDDIPLTSEDFRSHYWPIFCKHLSAHQKERNISAIHCMAIRNNTLEEKFKAFQKKLEDRGDPSEVSYGFYRLVGPPRETELIAQHGLFTGSTFIGDLGETSKGVHLNESPDLVTPAKFIENTRLRIMAFKVLKGRSNMVGLSSFTLEPTSGFTSHVARPPPTADSLSRHEVFRYNQVYLYDECEPGVYSNVPANVLPFAVFTVDFAPNATTSFKYMPITLWNGVLKIGERRYADMTLQSSGGILIKPPFFVLASGATVLVIPNGEFTSLLALPCREGPLFHILHFSKTLGDSLLTGTFEPFTPEEK
uniref:DUF3715 domain-containing protein n=1 Tax=Ascaris lumbricoides TaxID=6252 RepID=A0A0M3IGB3_ASCLU